MPEIKPFDGAAVLQAAPESPPKRRRGRPRVTPAMWDVYAERLEGPNKSRRTIIKRFDTGTALRALDTEDQDFGYITGPDKPRWEILAELGRLGDKDAIREAAAEICKREMKTKEAVARLRRSRIGKSKPGGIVALAREIERAIDDYLIRHPGMTRDQVRTALWFVTRGFEGDGEPSDDDDLPDEAGITEAASEKS